MPMDQGRCCLCGKRSQLERKIAKQKWKIRLPATRKKSETAYKRPVLLAFELKILLTPLVLVIPRFSSSVSICSAIHSFLPEASEIGELPLPLCCCRSFVISSSNSNESGLKIGISSVITENKLPWCLDGKMNWQVSEFSINQIWIGSESKQHSDCIRSPAAQNSPHEWS